MVDADGARQSVIWDRWGNKVMVTARDKQRTINQYDQRSRLTMRVEPTGARTTYDYDQADRVVRVTVAPEPDAAPSVTTFAYQGADRNPTTITDPCGGLTHLEWDHGLLVRVVDPVGVSLDLTYDHRGDLIATTNADGATARLERDARGRITAATTPPWATARSTATTRRATSPTAATPTAPCGGGSTRPVGACARWWTRPGAVPRSPMETTGLRSPRLTRWAG